MDTIKPYRNKGECLPIESDDLQQITVLAINSLRKHRGQAVYENSAEGLQRFVDDSISYFEMLREGNADRENDKQMFPSIEGLALFMGITRKTVAAYAKRSEEWGKTVDAVKNAIVACKCELASHYRVPPLVHVFDLTNNFSYYNTAEFKLTTEPTETRQQPQLTIDELDAIADTAGDVIPELPGKDTTNE